MLGLSPRSVYSWERASTVCDSLLSGLLGLEAGLRSLPFPCSGRPRPGSLRPHPGHCLQPPARSPPAAAHLLSSTPSCSVWASSSSKVTSRSPGQDDEAHFLQDRLHLSELQGIRWRLCTPSTVLGALSLWLLTGCLRGSDSWLSCSMESLVQTRIYFGEILKDLGFLKI